MAISTARPCPAWTPRRRGRSARRTATCCFAAVAARRSTRERVAALSYDSFYGERELAVPPSPSRGESTRSWWGSPRAGRAGACSTSDSGPGRSWRRRARGGVARQGVEVALPPAISAARASASTSSSDSAGGRPRERVVRRRGGERGPRGARRGRSAPSSPGSPHSAAPKGGLLSATGAGHRPRPAACRVACWARAGAWWRRPSTCSSSSLAGMRCLLHAGGFRSRSHRRQGAESARADRPYPPAPDVGARARGQWLSAQRRPPESARRKALKRALNGLLSVTRLGDTLKAAARTPGRRDARVAT